MNGAAARLALGMIWVVSCGSDPPPQARHARPLQAEPRHPNGAAEREAARPARAPGRPAAADPAAAVAESLGLDVAAVQWSATRKAFALAVPPKASDARADEDVPSVHKLLVYAASGEKRAAFDAVRPGAILELRFLGEERLVYLVPPPATSRGRPGKGRGHQGARKVAHKGARKAGAGARLPPGPPPPPPSVYAIQPIREDAAPTLCTGRRFVFAPEGDHIAWIAGDPGREALGADGVQVYPRSGTTSLPGEPAWSRDGASLAVIQGGPRPRLVVLVEVDNPNGDNSWPLPAETADDPSLRVFWAGVGNIVVGHELTRPVFATSFTRMPTPPAPPAAREAN